MLNRVCLVGRIVRDLELRRSSNNLPFCAFTLAVDNTYNGNKNTAFIPCFAWNKNAENMCKYLKKGSLIALEGRINTRPNMVNGQQITTTEIIGEHISFLDMKASSEKQEQPQYQTQSGYVDTRSTYQQVKEDAQFKKEEAILWDE